MAYNPSVVRELINAIFDEQGLVIFCFDYFEPVYRKFAAGQTKDTKVSILVEYVERHGKIDTLFFCIQEGNPDKYSEFEPRLFVSSSSDLILAKMVASIEETLDDTFVKLSSKMRVIFNWAIVGGVVGVTIGGIVGLIVGLLAVEGDPVFGILTGLFVGMSGLISGLIAGAIAGIIVVWQESKKAWEVIIGGGIIGAIVGVGIGITTGALISISSWPFSALDLVDSISWGCLLGLMSGAIVGGVVGLWVKHRIV